MKFCLLINVKLPTIIGILTFTGWPHSLENWENRENGEKDSLQGKIREFEILLKIREKLGIKKILSL